MSIVNRPETNTDTYDVFDFAMQMAVLRHILSYSEGVKWNVLKSEILSSITRLVSCESE